ncbi:MAG: cell division protein FtsW [Lachnospiraceae bacterium]|nr:cell division protein FtsW [Lachnospiraceae bacterium]
MRALDRIRNKYQRDTGKRPYFDFTLLVVVVLLVCFGFVMIYPASAYQANLKFGNSMYFLRKQIFAALMGFVIMAVLVFIPPKFYRIIPSWVYLAAAFVVMALLLVPGIHISSHGATRWIKLGPLPQFEPVELVKLLVIIFYSRTITRKQKDMDTWKGLAMPLIPVVALCIFIYISSHNMSSALIVFIIPVLMISIVAKDKKKILLVWGGLIVFAAIAVGVVVLMDKTGHSIGGFRGGRILAWLHPEKYSSDESFQTLQALYAIGSGGMFGKGLGESIVKIGDISEAQNDMIFSIVCEELGIFGAICLIFMFGILAYRLFVIAGNTRDLFNAMIVIGILCHISVQVILNIAVVTNSLPNTGVALPFISAGGTSVLLFLAEIGIALAVGRTIQLDRR